MARQRKLSNMKLTARFHFQYMGLWACITVALMCSTTIVLYLFLREHFLGANASYLAGQARFIEMQGVLVTVLFAGTALFAVAVILLAKMTAHRIAGPYLRLRMTFDAIQAGERSTKLRFRDTDQLDDLAESFNAMMGSVQGSERPGL